MSKLLKRLSGVLPVLFLLFLLTLMTSCESRKTIVNGLDEREANEILVLLSSKGVDANKIPSTEGAGGGGGQKMTLWDISVRSDEGTEAMFILNQNGLPRRRSQNLLTIFSNVGLVPSEMQDKIRYQAGLAAQIASTIQKIDGVLDAEVQISFPDEDPLNPLAQKKKITASVYVRHNGVLDDPNTHLITKIKRLVAASVPGLDYDDVTVIPDRARMNELPSGSLQGTLEEEKPFVSVWSLIIAKESLTRFRIIFFGLCLLTLLLLLSLIWILWKLHPLLEKQGGIKELFHLHPVGGKPAEEAKKEAEEKDKDKVKEGQAAIEDAKNKNVDET